jgi:hypothetical protein
MAYIMPSMLKYGVLLSTSSPWFEFCLTSKFLLSDPSSLFLRPKLANKNYVHVVTLIMAPRKSAVEVTQGKIMEVNYMKRSGSPLLWLLQPKVLPNDDFHLFTKFVVVRMKRNGCGSIAYKNRVNATFNNA